MAQFTSTSLARLLANVEREVLVAALAEANLSQLLTSEALATIDELQGLLNLLTNVRTFGPEFLGREFDEAISRFLDSAPLVSSALSTIDFFINAITSTNERLRVVQRGINDLLGIIETPPTPGKESFLQTVANIDEELRSVWRNHGRNARNRIRSFTPSFRATTEIRKADRDFLLNEFRQQQLHYDRAQENIAVLKNLIQGL